MEEIEKVSEDFNVKKPKKKGLIIGGIVLLILIIAILGVTYYFTSSKPEKLFNSYIDKLFASETEDYNSVKMNSEIKISGELKDSEAKQVFEEIGKCVLKIGAQADIEKRQEIVDLGLEYDKKSVIDAKIYYNDGKIYTYFDDIFDKYIEIDMDEYQKEALKEIFETADKNQIKNTQKAMKIVRDELKAELKEQGEFEKEKTEIDIGDKEEKVTKNTLTLSQKELYNLIANVCSSLAKNDDFLDCFEESPKDMLKEMAEDIKDEKVEGKNNVKISIYTKGISNKFVGMDISVNIESNSQTQTLTFTVLEEDKDVYSYAVGMKSSFMKVDLISGKVEIEKEKDTKKEQEGKAKITMEIAELGKMSLEMKYSAEYNNGIDKIDINNSVKMNDIKEDEVEAIMKKLMERPLIGELIEEKFGSILNENNANIPELEIGVPENEYNEYIEEPENEYNNIDTNKSNNNETITNFLTTNMDNEEEKQYTHTALSGCTIIESNGTSVTYKNKCESCNYISTTRNNINHSSGTYTSSFTCPNCKKVNSVKIQTNIK